MRNPLVKISHLLVPLAAGLIDETGTLSFELSALAYLECYNQDGLSERGPHYLIKMYVC